MRAQGNGRRKAMETSANPERPDRELQETDAVRLSERLWWLPPKGTMERAYKGYLYFKNGGRGFTMSDIDGRC